MACKGWPSRRACLYLFSNARGPPFALKITLHLGSWGLVGGALDRGAGSAMGGRMKLVRQWEGLTGPPPARPSCDCRTIQATIRRMHQCPMSWSCRGGDQTIPLTFFAGT